MRVTCLAPFLFCATVTAAAAQPAGGMAAMQYFVGTWACKATPVGAPALDVSVKFVMDSGILREWDEMRIPGTAAPYTISKSISYDAKNGRWVQVQAESDGAWIVSYLKPWAGNTEEWLDEAASDGKLGRNETIRTGANEFGFKGYANPSDTRANVEGTCMRST
jgi:hypothetical protein